MKKFILDLLKTKFEGVSEDVLEGMAAKLAKTATTEEQATTSVEGVTIQKVIESYTDRRVTQSVATAVENYKKNNPQPEPQKPNDTGDNGNTQQDETLKALLDKFAKLEGQMMQMNAEKVENGRRQQLNTLIEKLPKSMQSVYGHINLKEMDEEKFEAFKDSVKTDVETTLSELKANGATIQSPYQNTGHGNDELTEAQIALITRRSGSTEDGKQPF
jgi:hypothetical protein|nr:MAG TPA: hypothetical protein [Caudoviricetes sp.]